MDHFPLFANLRAERCLVVGGGHVAERKVRALLEAGAQVIVNAPGVTDGIRQLAVSGAVQVVATDFDPVLVDDVLLVVAATSDAAVNASVAAAARTARRLCNVVDDGPASSFIMPAVVDRSPVIIAISTGGAAPVLARRLRQTLEALLPERLGALARWADGWRGRLKTRLPDITTRRRAWEALLDGDAAAAVLAGNESAADAAAERIGTDSSLVATRGHAWLVGAGPGDPGLISVRGLEALRRADVVLHDRLVAPELLRAARREAEVVCVGKTGRGAATPQAEINALLVAHVRAGRRVCRLKGGDPLIFGRGGEEAQALAAAGLAFEIVPGITAASGCGAAAGIPLTHRGLATAVSFVTAQAAPGHPQPDFSAYAAPGHTLVVYMGGAEVASVAATLLRHGRDAGTPVALIANGTRADERRLFTTLGGLGARAGELSGLSPVLLIVGETVALAAELAPASLEPFALAAASQGQGEWRVTDGTAPPAMGTPH